MNYKLYMINVILLQITNGKSSCIEHYKSSSTTTDNGKTLNESFNFKVHTESHQNMTFRK